MAVVSDELWRRMVPMDSRPAPARSMLVASECRNMCDPVGRPSIPPRSSVRATMPAISADELNGRNGACERKNRCASMAVGRAAARYARIASPTSCGNGKRSGRRVLPTRSEEQTSELQSLMRISYAVFFLKKKKYTNDNQHTQTQTHDHTNNNHP